MFDLIDSSVTETMFNNKIHPGSIISGRYKLLEEIGRGGFGMVYKAQQIGLKRTVAIKLLSERNVEDLGVCQRFVREADLTKELIHPNTIQIYDAGEDPKGTFYMVMEYLEGETLDAILRKSGAISCQRCLNITKQILKSLFEAHQKGIIHRDLKPSNIMLRKVLGERDFVKVLDFGIAKVIRDNGGGVRTLTKSGTILGTPRYIAPELYRDDPIGSYSDIYSLGIMMIRMITGKSVIPRDPIAAMKAHISSDPIPLPIWLENTELHAILAKATEKDYRKRYQSSFEMLQDIEKMPFMSIYQFSEADLALGTTQTVRVIPSMEKTTIKMAEPVPLRTAEKKKASSSENHEKTPTATSKAATDKAHISSEYSPISVTLKKENSELNVMQQVNRLKYLIVGIVLISLVNAAAFLLWFFLQSPFKILPTAEISKPTSTQSMIMP